MKQSNIRWIALVSALGAILFLGACHKKQPPPPPPPPPPPAQPTATLTANPETIDKGQSSTLTWQTTNATDVSIDGIGAVQPNATQQVEARPRQHELPSMLRRHLRRLQLSLQ